MDPSEYECEDGLVLTAQYCGMMRSMVCVKEGCSSSRVSTWDGYGQCCPEFCAYRAGGTGAPCETKRVGACTDHERSGRFLLRGWLGFGTEPVL